MHRGREPRKLGLGREPGMPHENQTPTVQVRKNDYLILGTGGVNTWIGGLFDTGVGDGGRTTRSDDRLSMPPPVIPI